MLKTFSPQRRRGFAEVRGEVDQKAEIFLALA